MDAPTLVNVGGCNGYTTSRGKSCTMTKLRGARQQLSDSCRLPYHSPTQSMTPVMCRRLKRNVREMKSTSSLELQGLRYKAKNPVGNRQTYESCCLSHTCVTIRCLFHYTDMKDMAVIWGLFPEHHSMVEPALRDMICSCNTNSASAFAGKSRWSNAWPTWKVLSRRLPDGMLRNQRITVSVLGSCTT